MPRKFGKVAETLLKNKGIKLVALVLAITSWYAIRRVISHEKVVRDVPVNILLDEGWAVLDRSANSVDVLFGGSQGAIASLHSDDIRVVADMRGEASGGSVVVPLTPKHVQGALGGVRAMQVRPAEITLSLDQEGYNQLPVKAQIVSEPPVGYEVGKVVTTPASARLYGSLQRIREVDALQTEPIDLKGRVTSFEVRTPIASPSERWVARIEPDSALVNVTLVERSTSKTLKDVRVSALLSPELGPRVRIRPNKVDLVLSGRAELVEALEKEDLRAYVDCTDLGPSGNYTLPVRLHAVDGISATTIEPDAVSVEVGEL